MPTTDHCDTVATLVEQGTTTLEEAASVIGCPAPSLHIHLVQHDRDDLLRRLTYGGEPILEPVTAEPAAAEPEVDPEVVERSCQCDKWVFDDGEEDFEEPNEDGTGTTVHTEQACYQREPLPEVLAAAVPEEWAAEVETLTRAEDVDAEWAAYAEPLTQAEDDVVDAEILDADDHTDSLAWLCAHEDHEIREAAVALKMMLVKRNYDRLTKAEIERLTVERDHLTARIEELQAALEGEPEPASDMSCQCGAIDVAGANSSRVADGVAHSRRTCEPLARKLASQPTPAEIRAWCKPHGVDVPSRGTLPRAAIEAYQAAREASA